MKPLRLHRLASALLLAGIAALAACGPGVGGTGTGAAPDPAAFGATAASVCSAPFAAALQCPVGAGLPGTAGELVGTAQVHFADAAGQVSATLDGNAIQFIARCHGVEFSGSWGVVAPGPARFHGYLMRDGGPQLTGTLRVAPSGTSGASGTDLQVTLLDATELSVLGPVTLQPVAAPVLNPPACP